MTLDPRQRFPFSHGDITHPVYWQGEGPAVVLMHELPGMTPACLAVAQRIADSGFKVYLPLFFGEPNETRSLLGYAGALFCVRHEFNLFATEKPSPIADRLRALCRQADDECGHRGVGVIGMCLTGNIVLSVMLEPCVRVPVLCEPALPFGHQSSLGTPPSDLDEARCFAVRKPLLAYRFTTDTKCPPQRFDTLRQHFSPYVTATELKTGTAALPFVIPDGAHAVLTGNYPGEQDPNHPVQHVIDEILGRFKLTLV